MSSYIHNLVWFLIGILSFIFPVGGISLLAYSSYDWEKRGSWLVVFGMFVCVVGIIFIWPLSYTLGIFEHA